MRRVRLLVAAGLIAGLVVTTSGAAGAATPTGSIAGYVTDVDASANPPLAGVTVTLSGPATATTTTAANGTYSFSGLASGTYRVDFAKSGFAPQANGWRAPGQGAPIVLQPPKAITGINAQLTRTATLLGRIFDEQSAVGLKDAVALLFDDRRTGAPFAVAPSAADGSYRFTGLPPGTYTMQFQGPSDRYAGEYWQNTYVYARRVGVTVANATTVRADASLSRVAKVSGKVTASDTGAPIAGIDVRAVRKADGGFVGGATTASDGTYTITDLAPQSGVTLEFRPAFGNPPSPYAQAYLGGATDSAKATTVVLTPDTTTTGVNQALDRLGVITGTVRGVGGAALAGVDVRVTYPGSTTVAAFATTDSSGRYTAYGMAAGQYQLFFDPSSGAQSYAGEWDLDTYSQANARSTTVANRTTVTRDATLALNGSFSGKVTASDTHTFIPNTDLVLYAGTGTEPITTGSTNEDGTYQIIGLAPGTYRIEFHQHDGTAYSPRYYAGSSTLAGATLIQVRSGADTPNIDVMLPRA